MKILQLQKLLILSSILVAFLGCKKDAAAPDVIDDTMPVAQFEWNGNRLVNNEIQFVNKSLYADTYKWDFGNGQISVKEQPDNVTYTDEGAYTVLLTATKGERKVVYKQIIYIAADNQPAPFFTFEYKDGKTSAPATVVFKNQSVNTTNFKWKINGIIFSQLNPTYTFIQPGDYTVTLTGSNAIGEVTYGKTVKVDVNDEPQAGFTFAYHPFPYTVNEPIQLVNTSKNADEWLWTFGTNGPAQSKEQHPEVKFGASGTYTITLIAKKGSKQSAPRSITIKIN